VPLAQAERCVAALQEAGYAAAAIIGFVAERSDALEPVTVDLTGEQLAAALAGLHPARPRAHALRKDTGKTALSVGELQALIPPGHRPPHSRWLAIFAPSASDWNFAHTMLGCTSFEPAKVAKPQSAPAMTFSRPTTLA